ncbi:MAG: hypothetical protein KJ061_01780 [Vicinamibacteraceae bacterium]|nr:hypothetical protein [Vicinamibacteraceae bacterium]
MSTEQPRAAARQHLDALTASLKAELDRGRSEYAPLVEQCVHLDKAIAAFHMEAIRFRIFTLGRKLHDPALGASPDLLARYEEIRIALDAAGFHTRSVAM